MVVIADFTVYDGCVRGPCIIEKLFNLMAADIAQDSAVFLLFKKPGGTGGGIQAVRAHPQHLDYLADGSLPDQLACINGAFHLKPFAVAYHVFFTGLFHSFLYHIQLFQRSQRRFIHEIILAGLHHAHAKGSPLRRDTGGCHQLHFRVGKHLFFALRPPGSFLRVSLKEGFHLGRIRIVYPFQRSTRFQQTVGHPVNMPVIQPYGRNHKFSFFHHRVWLSLRCIVHTISFIHLCSPLLAASYFIF